MLRIEGPFRLTSFSAIPLPILRVRLSIHRPDGSALDREDDYYVDTGFTGDLKLPQSAGLEFERLGIRGSKVRARVASGLANNHIFGAEGGGIPMDGTDILLATRPCGVFCMDGDDTQNLIGLNALRDWKVCVNLPQRILSVE